MQTLQQQVDELLCDAFIGCVLNIEKHSPLAWHVSDDEERMKPINELIEELEAEKGDDQDDLPILKSLAAKGITEIILIREW